MKLSLRPIAAMYPILARLKATFDAAVLNKRHRSTTYHRCIAQPLIALSSLLLRVLLCFSLTSASLAFGADLPEGLDTTKPITENATAIQTPSLNESQDDARARQSPPEISSPETIEGEVEYGPQPPEAGDIRVYTPTYIPASDGYSPPLGTYRYTVDWEGIPAAFCNVTIDRTDGQFRASALVRTSSFIDIFYKLRYQVTGILSALTYSPESFITLHRENSRTRDLNIIFHSNPFSGHSDIESTRTTGSGSVKHQRFTTDNLTLDPITSVFLARSLPWQVGDSRQFDTFNGKSRYLITLTATDKKKIRVDDIVHDTIVIEPRVINLINKKQTAKLRKAYIYVTDDNKRDVIKITSKVLFGSVNTTLDSFVAASTSSGSSANSALFATGDKPV